MKEYIGWHFLASPDRLGYGDDRTPHKGETMTDPDLSESDGKLSPCKGGFHACAKPLDALCYAPGAFVARVRLSGEIAAQKDKACGTERTPLSDYVDVSSVLHEFACCCAEDALKVANVKDERCWNALEIKRRWIKGEATDRELLAARDAARDAAWDAARAAWAARDAARDAAWDAARDAAWAARDAAWAARDAAWAAWDAAWDAAWAAQNDKLSKMLREALELEGE